MMLAVLLVVVLLLAAVLAARRWLRLVRVSGASMAPTLSDGERVLVLRRRRQPRKGSIIVFSYGGELLIKRVVACPGDAVPESVRVGSSPAARDRVVGERQLVVLGDSGVGTDSRVFGYVPFDSVLGVVVRRLGRP